MTTTQQESTCCVDPIAGTQVWLNDKKQLHRVGGPAVVYVHGASEWWFNGLLHREDGPARECPNGDGSWFIHGKRHCTTGPAILSRIREWWVDGQLHRLDGPAIEYPDGRVRWFVRDRQFTEDEFYRFVDQLTGEILVPPGRYLTHDVHD